MMINGYIYCCWWESVTTVSNVYTVCVHVELVPYECMFSATQEVKQWRVGFLSVSLSHTLTPTNTLRYWLAFYVKPNEDRMPHTRIYMMPAFFFKNLTSFKELSLFCNRTASGINYIHCVFDTNLLVENVFFIFVEGLFRHAYKCVI